MSWRAKVGQGCHTAGPTMHAKGSTCQRCTRARARALCTGRWPRACGACCCKRGPGARAVERARTTAHGPPRGAQAATWRWGLLLQLVDATACAGARGPARAWCGGSRVSRGARLRAHRARRGLAVFRRALVARPGPRLRAAHFRAATLPSHAPPCCSFCSSLPVFAPPCLLLLRLAFTCLSLMPSPALLALASAASLRQRQLLAARTGLERVRAAPSSPALCESHRPTPARGRRCWGGAGRRWRGPGGGRP